MLIGWFRANHKDFSQQPSLRSETPYRCRLIWASTIFRLSGGASLNPVTSENRRHISTDDSYSTARHDASDLQRAEHTSMVSALSAPISLPSNLWFGPRS